MYSLCVMGGGGGGCRVCVCGWVGGLLCVSRGECWEGECVEWGGGGHIFN